VSRPVVVCEGVWKRYRKVEPLGIKELLVRRRKLVPNRFFREWAVRDVSFSVSPGEAFAVLGHNGSGKSTLLGLILGTLVSDRGRVCVSGRIGALLDIGAGFHPELTGRENVYLYGSILGMRIAEISRAYAAIEEFSELGDALENPIRTYSAGMITRLGFSIVAHSPCQVLLIDEVLAVGDQKFQQKCIAHLRSFKEAGGSLLIVSHDVKSVEKLCTGGICLSEGQVVASGSIGNIIACYRSSSRSVS